MVGTERTWALGPTGTCMTSRAGGLSRMPLVSRDAESCFSAQSWGFGSGKCVSHGEGPSAGLGGYFSNLLIVPGIPNKTFVKSGPKPSSLHQLQDGGSQGALVPGPAAPRASLGSALAASLRTPLPGPAELQAPWGQSPPPWLYPECLGQWATSPRGSPLPSGNLGNMWGPRPQD